MEQEKISLKGTAKVGYEIWKPIKGYKGYEISNFGNIKRFGRLLKLSAWNNYKVIRLRSNGNEKTMYVHRLVAMTFIPNPSNKPMVNHIDGNKLNNNSENLEWCTKQENEIHAWTHGMKEKIRETSKRNLEIARQFIHNKKAIVQMDVDGNVVKIWDSASDAMKITGIDSSGISKCCNGKLKIVGGYKWRFIE